MDLTVTSKLLINNGHALLPFPPVLKQEALEASLLCQSICFMANEEALDEPFFLVCSGSTHCTRNNKTKKNVLGMFQNSKKAHIVNFAHPVPLTYPQENLEIEIVDYKDKRQLLAATAVFSIQGKVSNTLLA